MVLVSRSMMGCLRRTHVPHSPPKRVHEVRRKRWRRKIRLSNELSRESEMGAVHELSRTEEGVRAHRGSNAQEHQWQMIHPGWRGGPGTKAFFDDAVDALDHPIALGMVRGSSQGRNAQHHVELRPQGRCELSSLVRGDVHRNAKTTDPVTSSNGPGW